MNKKLELIEKYICGSIHNVIYQIDEGSQNLLISSLKNNKNMIVIEIDSKDIYKDLSKIYLSVIKYYEKQGEVYIDIEHSYRKIQNINISKMTLEELIVHRQKLWNLERSRTREGAATRLIKFMIKQYFMDLLYFNTLKVYSNLKDKLTLEEEMRNKSVGIRV